MSDPRRSSTKTATAEEPKVHCRRIHLPMPVAEHLTCSYCFGTAEEVRSGDYEKFCDFCAGKDPVCFGFPEQ